MIKHAYVIGPKLSSNYINTKVCLSNERVTNLKLLLMERWGYIQAGEGGFVFKLGFYCFKTIFLTGVVLSFEWGDVLFKSGVTFKECYFMSSKGD